MMKQKTYVDASESEETTTTIKIEKRCTLDRMQERVASTERIR